MKEMKLSMDELEQVNGGEILCYEIGMSLPFENAVCYNGGEVLPYWDPVPKGGMLLTPEERKEVFGVG